jgi:hypothetical protein
MSEHLKNIREALIKIEQGSLFSGDETPLLSACERYLRSEGYKVSKPVVSHPKELKTIDDLISHFYQKLDYHQPNYLKVYVNWGRDRGIAKRFLQNRMDATGFKKSIALKECATIIDTFIENVKELNFKHDINFSIFGQAKMSWVTEWALEKMNKKAKRAQEDEAEKMRQSMLKQEDREVSIDELDAILKSLEEDEK